MVEKLNKISAKQLDALCEAANIGAGNAATAMAHLLKSKIEMSVPQARMLPFNEVPTLMGGVESNVVALYFHVTGLIPASILLVMPVDKVVQLLEILLGKPRETAAADVFSKMELSALLELGNILSSTYLNALAMFTNIRFTPSVPALTIDMAGAVLNAILAQYGAVSDMVLVMETGFQNGDLDVVGNMFLLPEPGSLELMLESLGVSI